MCFILLVVFLEKIYNVIIEKGQDGYYISEVIGLPGCHTQAKSIDELLERTKEAISLYLEVMRQDNEEIISTTNFMGLQQISVVE